MSSLATTRHATLSGDQTWLLKSTSLLRICPGTYSKSSEDLRPLDTTVASQSPGNKGGIRIQREPKTPPGQTSVVHIEPSRTFRLNLLELWSYRELLYFFIWRDIKVRYKQTVFGAAWAVLQPFLLMLVFAIFLGRLVKVPAEGIPYPLFVYTSLVMWTLFNKCLVGASQSLIARADLISKVYFPRLLLPLAAVGSNLVDFAASILLLLVMMVYYGVQPSLAMVTLPVWLLLAILISATVGVWLSALHVRYRDIQYVVGFLVVLWFYAAPVVYPASLISSQVSRTWLKIYELNPMVGVMEGFRWSMLQMQPPSGLSLISTTASTLGLLAAVAYFHRVERSFADVI